MRPLVAIQHHPSRAELLPRLVDRLEGLEHVVVPDEGGGKPDPWRGYLQCLELELAGYSHLVVLQDDAIPCSAFRCELECAIAGRPDATLILFLAAQPRLTAQAATRALGAGEPFCELHPRDFLPCVGVCWPAEHVADVLEWRETFRGRISRSDDHMLGCWHRDRRLPVLCTVPSIVDHPDDVPSVIGNGAGAHGRNPARVAMLLAVPD